SGSGGSRRPALGQKFFWSDLPTQRRRYRRGTHGQGESVGVESSEQHERLLDGRRVALVGRFGGMSHRQVEEIVRRHGGTIAPAIAADTDLVVVGDDSRDGRALARVQTELDDAARLAWQEGRLELVSESEFWSQLGLVDVEPDVQRYYTPAMLAELVGVTPRAVRHWHRQGHLAAERMVGRLAYFSFEQVRIAQRLAELVAAGCTLSQIDRKLNELARSQSEPLPLADQAVVVVGRRLYIRRGGQLTEPSGQLLLDFDAPRDAAEDAADAVTIPFAPAPRERHTAELDDRATDDLRSLADDFEQSGETERAIEVYRSILMSGDFSADDHFSLAELLYRSGDLAAARERYYAAIELDENFVEARANLGCLLVEQGESSLAEAAFRGALAYHPDFADAHFHLARLLDSQNQTAAASHHWRQFLDLAPASPWAEEALDRAGMGVTS
ncbi:MAG: MerR family transcriptional regulator, partial [Pirellulales bacterium]